MLGERRSGEVFGSRNNLEIRLPEQAAREDKRIGGPDRQNQSHFPQPEPEKSKEVEQKEALAELFFYTGAPAEEDWEPEERKIEERKTEERKTEAPERGPLYQGNRSPRTHDLFFSPQDDSRDFSSVLKEVQEYISSKYSTLIVDQGNEEVKEQIKRYITKYVQDYRIAVKGMESQELVDTIYTEMAEFSFLTKYVFGTGIEEIDSATRS